MTVRRTRWWLGYGHWWYAELFMQPNFWEETWIPLNSKGNASAEAKGKASWGKGNAAAEGKGKAAEGKGKAHGSDPAVAWAEWQRAVTPHLR